jgi:hypothetical protein
MCIKIDEFTFFCLTFFRELLDRFHMAFPVEVAPGVGDADSTFV